MIWQDWAILVGQVVLGLTLVPTVVAKAWVPYATSLPAVAVLAAFCAVFLTLGLYGAATTSALNALAWAAVVWVGYRYAQA